jgi:hypothetical protein
MKTKGRNNQHQKYGMLFLAFFSALFIVFAQPVAYLNQSIEQEVCARTNTESSENEKPQDFISVPTQEATFPIFQNPQPNLGPVLWENLLNTPELRWPRLTKPEPLLRFSKILLERIISPNAP